MWVWIIIAALFLYFLARFYQENASSGAPNGIVILGTLLDGLGLAAISLGVFGLLMALFLGIFNDTGAHLAGNSLRGVLLWSAGLILLGMLLMFGSIALRRRTRRVVVMARPMRGQ